MTRQSFQQGYVSDPIHTRRGLAFKIRYRVPGLDGKWKHKSETLYDVEGKKAARAVLSKRIGSAKPAGFTLKQFVETCWKPLWERKLLKPSTREYYQCNLDKHILPVLGELELSSITPLDVERFVGKLSVLRRRTQRNIITVLQRLFSLAEESDLIVKSPVRQHHRPESERSSKVAWSADQLRQILQAIPPQYEGLFVCAALTGLRLGELLGLQWKHVDLEARVLHVRQSLWHGKLVPPKTKTSVRSLPIGEALASRLLGGEPEAFVFANAEGKPISQNWLRRGVLYPALRKAALPVIPRASGFHAFRHSAASLIAAGGNLKLAQVFLGHSHLSTTADIYTHTSTTAERAAAQTLEDAIFGSVPNLFPVGFSPTSQVTDNRIVAR